MPASRPVGSVVGELPLPVEVAELVGLPVGEPVGLHEAPGAVVVEDELDVGEPVEVVDVGLPVGQVLGEDVELDDVVLVEDVLVEDVLEADVVLVDEELVDDVELEEDVVLDVEPLDEEDPVEVLDVVGPLVRVVVDEGDGRSVRAAGSVRPGGVLSGRRGDPAGTRPVRSSTERVPSR